MSENTPTIIADVMTNKFVLAHGLTTVSEALQIMREKDVNFLIVDRRDKTDEYGIMLASDIAKKVLAKDRSPDRINIYELMSKPVLFVRPGMDIRYCARFFDRFEISTSPVISKGQIVGVVSYNDLVLKGMGPPTAERAPRGPYSDDD
jgi:predicted transcriptional regulator